MSKTRRKIRDKLKSSKSNIGTAQNHLAWIWQQFHDREDGVSDALTVIIGLLEELRELIDKIDSEI